MSTRSYIYDSVNNKYIYCHFDGYPQGVGKTLKKYYRTQDAVDKLIALGDLSSLCKRLEPMRDTNGETTHNFNTPQVGVTIAYGRDRGGADIEASIGPPPLDVVSYVYSWDGNKWDILTHEGAMPL